MSIEQATLEAQAAKLREIVNAPTDKERAIVELVQVETQLAEQRQADAKAEAVERMKGVKRAYGSLLTEYEDDAKRVRDLYAAVEVMNARYASLVTYASEAAGLNKAHGLPLPAFAGLKNLERVQPPAVILRGLTMPRLFDVSDVSWIAREAAEPAAIAAAIAAAVAQIPSRPRPVLSEREQREAKRMAQVVGDANRALRTLGGRAGPQ